MNSEFFKTWFRNEYVPTVEKHLKDNNSAKKSVLLLDNAPSHPATDHLIHGDMKALFLPPKLMAVCQPMDQDVFEMLKKSIGRRFLSSLTSAIDNNEDYAIILKKIDMLDVIVVTRRMGSDSKHITCTPWKIRSGHEGGHLTLNPCV